MDELIKVIGPGGFGTALAILFARTGVPVGLYGRDEETMRRWQAMGYSDRYGWLEEATFPETLTLRSFDTLDLYKARYWVIATTVEGLGEIGPILRQIPKDAVIVLVQKGILPTGVTPGEYVSSLCQANIILLFTGSAFGKNLVDGAWVDMLVSAPAMFERHCLEFSQVLNGSHIRRSFSTDPRGVTYRNTMRTIASFEAGIVTAYLERIGQAHAPTLASAYNGLAWEARTLARNWGASDETVNAFSPAGRVCDIDFQMCLSPDSRNYRAGFDFGLGASLSEVIRQCDGVVEAIGNTKRIAEKERRLFPDWDNRYPWLARLYAVVHQGSNLEECARTMWERQMSRP